MAFAARIGFFVVVTQDTAPYEPEWPSTSPASTSWSPSMVSAAPFPALNSGQFSQGCHCTDDHFFGWGPCFERRNSLFKDWPKASLDFSLRFDVGAAIGATSVDDNRPALTTLRHCLTRARSVHGPLQPWSEAERPALRMSGCPKPLTYEIFDPLQLSEVRVNQDLNVR